MNSSASLPVANFLMKIFAEVFKAVMQAHLPALQQCEPRQKFVHAVATHEPLPLDDVEDPLLDVLPLEELGATHAPLVHVPPVLLQLSQVAPPVPHAPLSVPSWHVPELSQHPVAQLVESHVVPPLLLAPTGARPAGRAGYCRAAWLCLPPRLALLQCRQMRLHDGPWLHLRG